MSNPTKSRMWNFNGNGDDRSSISAQRSRWKRARPSAARISERALRTVASRVDPPWFANKQFSTISIFLFVTSPKNKIVPGTHHQWFSSSAGRSNRASANRCKHCSSCSSDSEASLHTHFAFSLTNHITHLISNSTNNSFHFQTHSHLNSLHSPHSNSFLKTLHF